MPVVSAVTGPVPKSPGHGHSGTTALSSDVDKCKHVMEIDEEHIDNLTDGLRDNTVLEDRMKMDDDGACQQAYEEDDLELDDTNGDQARDRSASNQNSGGDIIMEAFLKDTTVVPHVPAKRFPGEKRGKNRCQTASQSLGHNAASPPT